MGIVFKAVTEPTDDREPGSPPRGAGAGARRPIAFVVPAAAAGERLDLFLARQGELGSRTHVKLLARAGGVLVDGRRAKPGVSVEAGQRVVVLGIDLPEPVRRERPGPPPAAVPPRILHEDALILVVDKPAGLTTHRPENPRSGEPNLADTMDALRPGLSRAEGAERPGIVHRLDRETSGVMVLARTDDALFALKAQFRARTVEKEYRALVFGEPRFDADWIERPIAPQPDRGDRMMVVKDGGREAATYYEIVERFGDFTHVRCRPRTGRTHQIRVHMASIGHSLVGDRVYRSRNAQQSVLPPSAPDPGRHCLHALRLAFQHPHSHERMTFEAPFPDDLEQLLAWLRARTAGADA